ncbi:hypothetical protein [Carnobacterium maltaromaticum]|uniref:hypothetical protein n=1 Tax=Carnobacterium maltaromaticum TaxID=2751 RepID=UPI00295EE171|nr:hypothetical protein [Carnobacterium maltaromaticum]
MRIEDKWIDGFLYYIEFKILQEDIFKTIRKTIVIFEDLNEKELEILIKNSFRNVIAVENVDFYEDILFFKRDL